MISICKVLDIRRWQLDIRKIILWKSFSQVKKNPNKTKTKYENRKTARNLLPLHCTICIAKSTATLKNKNLRILKHFKLKFSLTFSSILFWKLQKEIKVNSQEAEEKKIHLTELFIHIQYCQGTETSVIHTAPVIIALYKDWWLQSTQELIISFSPF